MGAESSIPIRGTFSQELEPQDFIIGALLSRTFRRYLETLGLSYVEQWSWFESHFVIIGEQHALVVPREVAGPVTRR